mgnify:CR=1 FL=1
MKHLILSYERGGHRRRVMKAALEELGHTVTVVTSSYDNISEKHDRIWTLAESLLPIQAKYDKLWNIGDMSMSAANILTNKKSFDDFCSKIGLEEIIPKSVIPLSPDDIFNGPSIVKPTIGSGTKLNGISYTSYYSKEELLMNLPNNFFEINRIGYRDPKFNNNLTHYMVQEKLPYESVIYAPYYYVDNNSNGKLLFWVRGKLKRTVTNNNQFLDHPGSFHVVPQDEVPTKIVDYANTLFEYITDFLQVKNIFFSGPDFYDYDNKVKYIDCNPRIGQGVQLSNDIQPGYLKQIIAGEDVELKTRWLWHTADLKPGKIKSVGDYSHLEKYIIKETSKKIIKGTTVKEQTNTSCDFFNFNFIITGKDEPDMYKTYRAVQSEFQSLIEYY